MPMVVFTSFLSRRVESRGMPVELLEGYLGYTSFLAVYRETRDSLSLAQGPSADISARTSINDSPQSSEVRGGHTADGDNNKSVVLSPRILEHSLIVLRRIPSTDVALSLFQKHTNPNDGWIRLAAQRVIESMLSVFGRQLRSRKPKDLEELARILSENTAKPWCEEEPDPDAWQASFSGQNMRWECLGILFTYWALASLSDQAHRTEPQKSITAVYHEAAELCIDLCRNSVPNSLLQYLTYKVAVIDSIKSGDTSPGFWKLHGQQIALATYLGMHTIQQSASYVPTVAAEARRRLISQIFVVDKAAASFNGRPPLLSRKYMLTPLPLDLCDEVLLSDPDTIAKAVEALDDNGWNKDGKCYSTTIVRARRMLASVKDEVMEVSLGDPTCTSTEALLALRERELEAFSGLPGDVKYRSEDVRDLRVTSSELYAKIVIHLEHLQNLFFISRLLIKWGYSNHAELLKVSFEMVAVTLVFWTHMDRLAGLHGDFEWLVMAYAAPAGGILCNELLGPPQHIHIAGMTRSSIIQQLSLLNGFLDWVSPSAPNGDLCSSCKTVIQHVLDHALNAPPQGSSDAADENAFDFNIDLSSDIDAINGYFNFDLLDTYDWLRPDMLSNQHSV
ncbi:hypothetical protein VMCG_04902 [Cytospora schulzeri]|uniref:Xylanolytic transcriptional activator regulatory domain-containing protein n=1 Tax=Cytospora schulzeri TaxID=448051 RepID=A0A423WN69_9PEZI|nr:hypothetical protein VMCG_04902 [Valsa malicola]